jgi:5-(carboxyamino)imidazole ribonucleotide mutase
MGAGAVGAFSRSPENVVPETAVDERTAGAGPPSVGIIMGSSSDWKTMRPAARALEELGVSCEARVVSAHRTPDDLFAYAEAAEARGLSLIIAGAGGAAHLPGMTASKTIVPVVGVPVEATPLRGLDALLSIMQMPAGIGVATVGVGERGAERAAHFAAAALASRDRKRVAVLAREETDLTVLRHAEEYLSRLGVLFEMLVLGQGAGVGLAQQVAELEPRGFGALIAGSGGGITFATEVGQATRLPVLAVPIVSGPVPSDRIEPFLQQFLDLPPRVATFAIGKPGAVNAALFAATILSGPGSRTWQELHGLRAAQVEQVRAMKLE